MMIYIQQALLSFTDLYHSKESWESLSLEREIEYIEEIGLF